MGADPHPPSRSAEGYPTRRYDYVLYFIDTSVMNELALTVARFADTYVIGWTKTEPICVT